MTTCGYATWGMAVCRGVVPQHDQRVVRRLELPELFLDMAPAGA